MAVFYLVLNGPPSCGKSTLQRHAIRAFTYKLKAFPESIAAPIKQCFAALLGIPYSSIKKDVKSDLLKLANIDRNHDPREGLIELSESHFKRLYGDDIFGRALMYRTRSTNRVHRDQVFVIDDCGFDAEFTAFPRENTYLVRIMRPGFDFQSDSRSYVSNPDRILINDGDLHKAESLMDDIVQQCLWKWRINGGEDEEE
jgi:hypothetical protein